MKHLFIFLIFLFPVIKMTAQKNDLGSWNILNLKYDVDQKWTVFAEAQLRSLKFYDDFHYYEYKGGVQYKVKKDVVLTLGAGSYQTYKSGGNFVLPKNNNEFRIWPQVTFTQSLGKFKLEHRYRTELRFTSNGYRNRFRYRLGASYPFGKNKKGFQPFQLKANNEVFFTNNEPYFERNRWAITLDYKPTKYNTIQIGYLHQFDYRINDEIGRDFFQIGYTIDLSKRK